MIIAPALNPSWQLSYRATEQTPVEVDRGVRASAPFDAAIEEDDRPAWRLEGVSQLELPGKGTRVTSGVPGKRIDGGPSRHCIQAEKQRWQEHRVYQQLQDREPPARGI